MLSLHQRLIARQRDGNLRGLSIDRDGVDFSSNDYLGLARNPTLQQDIVHEIERSQFCIAGSTGSRLLTGNSAYLMDLEEEVAQKHQTEAALLFPSGYVANLTLFSCLPQRGDTLIIDELIHNSIHYGSRLSFARKLKFKHNDPESLKDKLSKAKGNCFVAIESLYSMNGDWAPIQEILEVCSFFNAQLIVDEAHAFGVFGKGLVHAFGLQNRVLATLVTYGKAMGCHGAAVLGSALLKNYLINFGQPFIYSTAPSDLFGVCIKKGYEFLETHPGLPAVLKNKIQFFRDEISLSVSAVESPIQVMIISGNNEVKEAAHWLQTEGFRVYPIFSPTVAVGKERIRICLHTFNTEREILELTQLMKNLN